MKVSDIIGVLERIAPPQLAEQWDNVGLIVGDEQSSAGGLMLCIDLTDAVLAEAQGAGAKMVMAYHPPIFKGLSRLTAGSSPAGYAAARAGMAVYSMHSAWDAAPGGLTDLLADLLGLIDRRPLEPSTGRGLCKIVSFVPPRDMSNVADAAFAAGAGRVGNYHRCAFFSHGIGTFHGDRGAHPTVGLPGRQEATEEMRLEIIAPRPRAAEVCSAIRAVHSYEEPVVDVYALEDFPDGCGAGRIGNLQQPASLQTVVSRVKKALGLPELLVVDATRGQGKEELRRRPASSKRSASRGKDRGVQTGQITTAACCPGSSGTLAAAAASAGAQLYLTGEMRHHDALAAAARGMSVICAGHSHSERFALPELARKIRQSLPKLTVAISRADRDPFAVL